jgi:hypothetical protein
MSDCGRDVSDTCERTAVQFLTETGRSCSDRLAASERLRISVPNGDMFPPFSRQEFILLSDVLGVSALVDTLNNPKPPEATQSTILGPFFTTDAPDSGSTPGDRQPLRDPAHSGFDEFTVAFGESIASEDKGEYLFVEGSILDTKVSASSIFCPTIRVVVDAIHRLGANPSRMP